MSNEHKQAKGQVITINITVMQSSLPIIIKPTRFNVMQRKDGEKELKSSNNNNGTIHKIK